MKKILIMALLFSFTLFNPLIILSKQYTVDYINIKVDLPDDFIVATRTSDLQILKNLGYETRDIFLREMNAIYAYLVAVDSSYGNMLDIKSITDAEIKKISNLRTLPKEKRKEIAENLIKGFKTDNVKFGEYENRGVLYITLEGFGQYEELNNQRCFFSLYSTIINGNLFVFKLILLDSKNISQNRQLLRTIVDSVDYSNHNKAQPNLDEIEREAGIIPASSASNNSGIDFEKMEREAGLIPASSVPKADNINWDEVEREVGIKPASPAQNNGSIDFDELERRAFGSALAIAVIVAILSLIICLIIFILRELNYMETLKDYISFSGRLNRLAYFTRFLVANLLFSFFFFLILIVGDSGLSGVLGIEAITLSLVMIYIPFILFYLSIMTRRLHDLNYSGLWILPLIILAALADTIISKILMGWPKGLIFSLIIPLLLLFIKGTTGTNKYGEDPLQNKK